MVKGIPQRPGGSGSLPTRSARISDAVWSKATARAKHERVTMSFVMATLVEGYGRGLIDLPTMRMVFKPSPTDEVE